MACQEHRNPLRFRCAMTLGRWRSRRLVLKDLQGSGGEFDLPRLHFVVGVAFGNFAGLFVLSMREKG